MNPLNLRVTPLNPAGPQRTLPHPDSLSRDVAGNWTLRYSSPVRVPDVAGLLSRYPDQKMTRSRLYVVEIDPGYAVVRLQFRAKTRYVEVEDVDVKGVLVAVGGPELSPQSHGLTLMLYRADFLMVRGSGAEVAV